ncbi:hypothetical protein [Salinimicrobium gaetbulicola]|uniref:Uncharacterized protein n=1 Tax=Salinimicrobium gaetbulicola TaxID=999702 RepID=A0ABW3IGJ1_9FLAO
MGYSEKFRKEKTFCKHPIEECVVRTVPTSEFSWETYLMFFGEEEYMPVQHSNIVLEVELATELEFITEEDYYSYIKKKKLNFLRQKHLKESEGYKTLL